MQSQAQIRATKKWKQKNYKTKLINFRTDEFEKLKQIANEKGVSVQKLIRQAMYEYGLLDSVGIYKEDEPVKKEKNKWYV